MSIHRGGETFADLGGLDGAQGVLPALADPQAVQLAGASSGRPSARRPGTGKSAFCKALGNEVGRPTLMLDIGALMGSLVGMTEERTRQALRIADAMAPCIVFIDEIEKGLSGVQASGQTDSGVSARMFGTLLSYLNDHESDVYFVCSANDVSKLPPEFTQSRALRRDLLPRPARVAGEGADLAAVPGEVRARPGQKRPSDRDFTGAEIRACCRLAALLGVPLVGGRGEHRPGGRHGRRVGRTPAELGRQADACRPTGPASTRAWRPAPARRDAASIAATRRPTDSRALEPADVVALFAQFAECTPAFDSANCANFASHFPFSGTSLKAPLVDPPHHPIATARRSHVRSNQDHRPRCRLLPQ